MDAASILRTIIALALVGLVVLVGARLAGKAAARAAV